MSTRDHNNRSEKQKGHTPDHSGEGTDTKATHGGKPNRSGGGDNAGGPPTTQGQGEANEGHETGQNQGHGGHK